jgi:hypothetical protein
MMLMQGNVNGISNFPKKLKQIALAELKGDDSK